MPSLMTSTMPIELLGEINSYIAIGIKVVCAIFVGAVIGLDREKKLKSAGIKTQILICLGATLFTLISLLNYQYYINTNPSDPNRVAAQIVSGIGFLGAGAIFQQRGLVVGMTTAAAIWIVAALGIAIGSGYVFSALLFTLTTLIVLNMIEPLMRLIQPEKHFILEVIGSDDGLKRLSRKLDELETNIIDQQVFSNKETSKSNVHLDIRASNREFKRIIEYCNSSKSIEQFTFQVTK